MGQVPDPCVRICGKNSSPVDSYQPLVTGPLGANVSDVLKEACPPSVCDQVDRSTRLDPVGPREMISLGDVAKPASMGPVGRPWRTGQLVMEPDEPDFVRSSPTRSESDMDTELLPPVIKAEGEVLRGRVRPSVVMEKTEPSEVKCSPGVQVNTVESSSVSPSVNPDPVIRTGADDRTNNMKSEMIKGQSDLSVVSPSSDSGVHSVDEQWDCMSTYSGESDSIQSVKTVYGGVACQTDSPVVKLRNMESRGVINPLKGQHGDHDSMPSLSTNGHNSDIADMGDFSDEEEEQWEEVEPSEDVQMDVRTDCVMNDRMSSLSTIGHNSDIADMGDFSDEEDEQWEEVEPSEDVQTEVRTDGVGNNASNSRERSELPKKPTVVTPHDMEIHDEDYWTKFRLLAKQAFKLDNVALPASDYPVAVKELVVRSRVTMQDINDRADRWYVEQQELEAAGETVESSFFYSDTDRFEDFTIPIYTDIPWGEDNRPVRATRAALVTGSIRARGRFGCWGRPVRSADWLDVRPMDGGPVGTDVWIKYIGDSLSWYQSTDAAPLTEVHDINIILHISSDCFARLCSTRIVSLTVRINWSLEEVLRCGGVLSLCQTMDGAALANDRSGITFTADLCVPWDAPEAVVEMNSPDLISLEPLPDKVGLFGRRKEAAMSRIMRGRDCRSV